ncbi:AbiU2 domain-containing protein [Bradyrhizobium liaoningense]
MAKEDRCWFWWMPEPDDWHRFVFTNLVTAQMFGGYVNRDIIKQDEKRFRRRWVSSDEIRLFADHCAYIRSVFEYYLRIFRQGTVDEYAAMEAVAPRFFEDLAQVYNEFTVIAACRITDPSIDKFGNKNLVIGHFTKLLDRFEPLHRRLTMLQADMEKHRERIKDARDKLTVHADLLTIMEGQPIGTATWEHWEQFWKDLGEFVSLVNENVNGAPFEIRAAMVRGDAEMVLRKVQS